MATIVQFRRGTLAQHDSFTGANGEISVATDINTLFVHDGVTQGGFRIAKHDEIASLASNTYVTNQLALKANSSYVTSLVASEISNLVDAAPGALDTLNELAAAIGDDANFVTTINTSLGTKAANTYVNQELALKADLSYAAANTYVNTTVANYLSVANSFSSLSTLDDNTSVTSVLKNLTNEDRVVANPDGYIALTIEGVEYKIPYFS